MKRTILMMLVALPTSCIVDPGVNEVEQATPAALNPAECRDRSARVFNECLMECNGSLDGADGTKTQCLTTADGTLRGYFQELSARLTPELLLQGPNGSDLEVAIQEEITKWKDARWECEDAFNQASAQRDDCTGWARATQGSPGGCETQRSAAYSQCVGTCEGDIAAGSACAPQSARVPRWAECGVMQSVQSGAREGQCDCYSNEGNWFFQSDQGSRCKQVLDLMSDARYGTACGNGPGSRWTPQVSKTAEGAPADVRMRCVPWNGNQPDFSRAFDPQAGR